MKNFLLGLFLLLAVGCQTSPSGRKQLTALPEDQMVQMGHQAFDELKRTMTISRDPAANSYVQCVCQHLLNTLGEKKSDWEVVVFEEASANAFALPGNKIGVHTGLLEVAKNQDQLAAVIGHEIAHVKARHGNERASQQLLSQGGLSLLSVILSEKSGANYQYIMGAIGLGLQYGVLMPYSRNQESEADILGLDYMARAGFRPAESITLWQNMESAGGKGPPEFLSTHPSHGTRITQLRKNLDSAQAKYEQSKNNPNCVFRTVAPSSK
jgi:predicted Zn-dependent protease